MGHPASEITKPVVECPSVVANYRYSSGNYHFFDSVTEWYGHTQSGLVTEFLISWPFFAMFQTLWTRPDMMIDARRPIQTRPTANDDEMK